jgi:hypothetical protein
MVAQERVGLGNGLVDPHGQIPVVDADDHVLVGLSNHVYGCGRLVRAD